MLINRGSVKGTIRNRIQVKGKINSYGRIVGRVKTGMNTIEEYTGSVTIVPNDDIQVLYTEDKLVLTNIKIQPVGSEYGHISYDGSKLLVY